MDGVILPTTSAAIAWQINGAENLKLDLRIGNGGSLGDFSTSTPTGGTTFLELHTIRWGKVSIEAMDYAGRVAHFTAGGTDQKTRCRMMDIDIKTGNRLVEGEDTRCGQPFFADSGNCVQTGAFGKISWRSEGVQYGPVCERLNDIDFRTVEAGKFVVAGFEIRGCVAVWFDVLYIGESDGTGGANAPGLLFTQTAAGRLNAAVYIDRASFLRCTTGLKLEDFDSASTGVVINSFNASDCTTGLQSDVISSLKVSSLSGKGNTNLVIIDGNSADLDLHFTDVGAHTGDVVDIQAGSTKRVHLTGKIEGGASGFSLIKLPNNGEDINIQDMHLESSVCDQLIDIQFPGNTSIRHIGGLVDGTSPAYTPGRRAEFIEGVKNLQTRSFGTNSITTGNTDVTVNHGLDITPSYVNAIGIGAEAAAPYLASLTSTQITFRLPAAVTSTKSIYWEASAVLALGDRDA